MNELSSFETRLLEELKSLNDRLSAANLGFPQADSHSRFEVDDLRKSVAAHGMGAANADTAPELVLQGKSSSSESDSRLPGWKRTVRINDTWTLVLVPLVIGAAILLGTLVGWRLGWQKANAGIRAGSPVHRENLPSKTGQTDHALSAAAELQPSSPSLDECGQAATAVTRAHPPSSGLTICQSGRVIFRSPHAALSQVRDVQPPQRSPGLEGDPARR